jgi:hypothetical protein
MRYKTLTQRRSQTDGLDLVVKEIDVDLDEFELKVHAIMIVSFTTFHLTFITLNIAFSKNFFFEAFFNLRS